MNLPQKDELNLFSSSRNLIKIVSINHENPEKTIPRPKSKNQIAQNHPGTYVKLSYNKEINRFSSYQYLKQIGLDDMFIFENAKRKFKK